MLIFSLFLLIKSSLLMLQAPKLSQRCRLWVESQKNLEDEKFWKFWSKLCKLWKKMSFSTKLRFIQKHVLLYNLSYSNTRVLKFGRCMQKKSTKNLQKGKIWIFDFPNFIEFFWFFKWKTNKNRDKNDKNKKSKFRYL